MRKIIILLSILMLVCLIFCGCTDVNIPDDLTKKMTIVTFTVTPSSIELGDSANLSWVVTGSNTSVNIDNGIGEVSLKGNRIISPTETTTYKLTAINGSSTKNVTTQIIVILNTSKENNSESTPDIEFNKEVSPTKGLRVARADTDLLWSDFDIVGGTAMSGSVQVGDFIALTTNSTQITIRYIDTKTLMGNWTFVNEEPKTQTPDIEFNKEVTPTKGLRVVKADTGIKWNNIAITGGTKPNLSGVIISAGQFIALNTTSSNIIIVYTPTNTLLGTWTWG